MIAARAIVLLVAIGLAVSGCSTVRKLTKKNDSTVLPGEREEILSPDQYKVEDPIVKDGQAGGASPSTPEPQCDPNVDPSCGETIDQEAAG